MFYSYPFPWNNMGGGGGVKGEKQKDRSIYNLFRCPQSKLNLNTFLKQGKQVSFIFWSGSKDEADIKYLQ